MRAISQAGLYPSNCRILDPAEAHNTGAGNGSVAIMVLAFESSGAEAHREGAADATQCAMSKIEGGGGVLTVKGFRLGK